MNHLKIISKAFSFSFLMVLLICSCGSEPKNTQTAAAPAKAPIADANPPKAVEASLTNEKIESAKEAVKEVKPVAVEEIKAPKEVKKKATKKKKKERKPRAKLVFDQPTHDYGFIMQGDKVKHDFNFRNIGDDDLLITRVKPSCGCTTPSYPKEVIPPGGSGKISVVFDSAGKLGRQIPKIDVYTNYERRLSVKLEGFVDAERAKPPTAIKEKIEEVKEAIEEAPKVEADTSSMGGM